MLKNKLLSAMGGVEANYIEDVFSTYLYTGTGSALTITNGIDLAGEGGLVWMKRRGPSAGNHGLYDSARGPTTGLATNNTAGNFGADCAGFNSNGFTAFNNTGQINGANDSVVSWTFRKQPKFFDVVTYTGDGSNRTIAHSLSSVPGCIIVKRTDTTADWQVYHRANTANPETDYLVLNSTAATADSDTRWNDTQPTATVFSLGTEATVNASGGTYVAYLFAHDAGGFGLTGTDNVISCGSFTSNSDGSASVNLGHEPQFLLYKRTDSTGDWILLDTMRGFSQTSGVLLRPNTSGAEQVVSGDLWNPTATGFIGEPGTFGVSTQNIYIAIRRGPMKVPTTGTSVFAPVTYTGNATQGTARNTGFVTDLVISGSRDQATNKVAYDRLRGAANRLATSTTDAATSESGTTIGLFGFDTNNGYIAGQDQGAGSINFSGWTYANWNFRRAPGFFDEVCYTGTGGAMTVSHNLGVAPELIINKVRSTTGSWFVYKPSSSASYGKLETTDAFAGSANIPATATTYDPISYSGSTTYVSYLFATCPGVSKVGSYTGNGSSQTINCGFTGGARFVMIKRTDDAGDWVLWDSSRGMVAGTDPRLALNSTAAEVNANWVYTTTGGFEIVTSDAAVNASGGSYIFLSIA